jgi:hypothetical protein
VNGAFDPVVEGPTEETNGKKVAQGQQEIGGFFSKLSDMQIAEKLEERKVNEVQGERDFP